MPDYFEKLKRMVPVYDHKFPLRIFRLAKQGLATGDNDDTELSDALDRVIDYYEEMDRKPRDGIYVVAMSPPPFLK